jgi:excisionase family DNA binding protein
MTLLIMEEKLLLSTVPMEQFYTEIRKIVQAALAEQQPDELPQAPNQYLTRKEVSVILRISLPTLHQWTKNSFIKSYRIGNKVYYKSVDIEKSMKLRQY